MTHYCLSGQAVVLQEGKARLGCLALVCIAIHKHLGHRARTVSFLLIGLKKHFNVLNSNFVQNIQNAALIGVIITSYIL